MRIAEQYDLSGLAHEAAIAHSIALGREGTATKDPKVLCRSVHEWYEADRSTRSTPAIQLGPDQDEDDFVRNVKIFRGIDQASYQSCLQSAGADANQVNDSIKQLSLQSKKELTAIQVVSKTGNSFIVGFNLDVKSASH